MTNLHRKNNVTLVLVTHDIALATKSQRQIMLRDGRIEADVLN